LKSAPLKFADCGVTCVAAICDEALARPMSRQWKGYWQKAINT